jgi:hypothetical protein
MDQSVNNIRWCHLFASRKEAEREV